MDTPTIAKYYREQDPMKRLALLEKSTEQGEEPEANAIRRELWDLRYSENSELGPDTRADGFLALWMTMEFNRNAGSRFFGEKSASKEIRKYLTKLKFQETRARGELYEQLMYRECCHLIMLYLELCKKDKSYNTTLFGIVRINEERATSKIHRDIYETAVCLPETLKMQEELGIITRAARETYSLYYPNEEPI